MRRTKIVATLGPASQEPGVIDALIEEGADVLRLNVAHGDAATHHQIAARVQEAADRQERVVGILGDLPGPKMRTGAIAGGEVLLEAGDAFSLLPGGTSGDETACSTTVPELHRWVSPGEEIFLADGQIVLEVGGVEEGTVHTQVVRGGVLRSGKGMHVPGAEHKVEAFTARDEEALRTAVEIGVDFIGLSFVRGREDLERVRQKLQGYPKAPALLAKIETRTAVENLDGIVTSADAVMVARGDLGIQLPFRQVPLLQKDIISACNEVGTPVVTATQMLESMTRSPLPTRAEVNDVANAVLDGTDAIMLSEETAVGDYPVEALRVMGEIAMEAEQRTAVAVALGAPHEEDPVSWAIARAAVQASEELGVTSILCPTRSGATARRVAAFRPSMPVLATDHSPEVLRTLSIVWGVVPFQVPFLSDDQLAAHGLARALTAVHDSGIARSGDLVTMVAGGTAPRAGSTDFLRVLHL